MQIINALLISTLAGLSTVVGGLVVFLKVKNINKFISFCLSFTAIIMLGISILELFPESFFKLVSKYNITHILLIIIFLFIISALIIRIINYFLKTTNNWYKIGILNMIALMLHNFPEGITTFITSFHNINIGLKISIAIMFHNIPEGIAIAAPIYSATKSKKEALLKTFISGISEPIGALFAYLFLKNYINDYLISLLLIIVACIMICLSIEKILPEAIKSDNKDSMLFGIILGVVVLFITVFLF